MNRTFSIGITLVLALLAPRGTPLRATGSTAAVVFEWNQMLQDSFPTQGPGTLRPFSMTHIAMFDAINAIERAFEPYRVRLRHAEGSADAAAAQAAHDVLVALNPGAAATYDAALARQLGHRPSGFIRNGAEVGARVAKEILAWRQNDGWLVSPPPPYVEPKLPGRWQPTPGVTAAAFTHLQKAAPLALLSPTQYLPLPPPSLTSDRYAADLEEIRLIGRRDSTTRTDQQTEIARLWAGVARSGTGTATNFLSIWNNIVRAVAQERCLSLVETARLFVLVNVSVHDALQTSQTSKFVYGLWRPITAIQQADTDLNPKTDPADPTWLPLITTPPYPSYAGNMATIGASAARALQLAFETNDIPVTATWRQSDGQGEVSHHFPGFWEVADEQHMARIYGGIHYRFDNEAGQQIGRSTAEYVFANFMAPRGR